MHVALLPRSGANSRLLVAVLLPVLLLAAALAGRMTPPADAAPTAASLVSARAKFFGTANVDVRTGAVRKDRIARA